MATAKSFERGDEVLSKIPGGSIMTVLAVEGLKVRCSDAQDRQYWYDSNLLEPYHWTPSGLVASDSALFVSAGSESPLRLAHLPDEIRHHTS